MRLPHDEGEDDRLRKALERLLHDLDDESVGRRAHYRPVSLWDRLAAEGKWSLIDELRMVEDGVGGYGTIVCPATGFSDNDVTHNAVIDWLKPKKVNVICVDSMVKRLFLALHGPEVEYA
jgi:hypothetical protein